MACGGWCACNAFTADPRSLVDYPLADRRRPAFALAWVRENVAQLSEIRRRASAGLPTGTRRRGSPMRTLRPALRPAGSRGGRILPHRSGRAGGRGENGAALGQIAAVHDYGGGCSLEIAAGGAAGAVHPRGGAGGGYRGRHVVVESPAESEVGGGAMSWRADILTLFPEMFPGPLGQSLAGRALGAGSGPGGTRYPRFRPRPPPRGGRHAVRRRCRHGDAAGCDGCGHRLGRR